MKKAVITTGGKQYIAAEGETLEVELIKNALRPGSASSAGKTLDFEPLLIIDGEKISVGAPKVNGAKVSAEIVEADVKAEKVTAIRYKAKKRVRKVRGHRQRHSLIKITRIS